MDMRLKLAIEFLKTPNLFANDTVADTVAAAIEMAEELMKQGEENGLIEPLPDHGDLNRAAKNHIEMNVRAQLFQTDIAQRIASGSIKTVPGGTILNG